MGEGEPHSFPPTASPKPCLLINFKSQAKALLERSTLKRGRLYLKLGRGRRCRISVAHPLFTPLRFGLVREIFPDRKSTRLNSSHVAISYAVFCLKKKRH